MRLCLAFGLLCLPSIGNAQERFGDWVAAQFGSQPFYAQSIGWDMSEPSVIVTDPASANDAKGRLIDTPETTAWLVGMLDHQGDDRLSGMALVWSDGLIDRVVALPSIVSKSGIVGFQTGRDFALMQNAPADDVAALVSAQLDMVAPGPVLVRLPAGIEFPVGDSALPDRCFEVSALYKDDDALVALVVLFKSYSRDDGGTAACSPLTS